MRFGLLMLLVLCVLLPVPPATAQDGALVAVAATASGNGVLTIPTGGLAAFSFAVLNYGDAAVQFFTRVTAPSTVTIVGLCLTDPTTGQCLAGFLGLTPGSQIPPGGQPFLPSIQPGQVITGTVFVTTSVPVGPICPNPFRIVVSFLNTFVATLGPPECSPHGLPQPGDEYTSTSVGRAGAALVRARRKPCSDD